MPSTTDDARMAEMPASAPLQRRSFTREDYHAMGRAGILTPEDLGHDRIEASSEPASDGYRVTRRHGLGDSLSPVALPDLTLQTDQIIPPRPPAG